MCCFCMCLWVYLRVCICVHDCVFFFVCLDACLRVTCAPVSMARGPMLDRGLHSRRRGRAPRDCALPQHHPPLFGPSRCICSPELQWDPHQVKIFAQIWLMEISADPPLGGLPAGLANGEFFSNNRCEAAKKFWTPKTCQSCPFLAIFGIFRNKICKMAVNGPPRGP